MQTPTSALLRPVSLSRIATAPLVLATLVVGSIAVRLGAAFERSTPRYFPDEYLYAQLARSLGHGAGVTVLGVSSTFPALLEPLLTAPFWGLTDTETAFRLTQLLNATAMSLAAVPVYLLARRLRLTTGWAVGCAAVTIVSPALLYAGYVTADALGYLLALSAVLAAVRAQTISTRTAEATFLVVAGLATLARIQYAALFIAFAVVAVGTERRNVLRRYPLTVGATILGLAALAVAGPTLLGRYGSVTTFGVSGETLAWAPATGFLLSAAAGVAVVPGAIAWLSVQVGPVRAGPRPGFGRLAAALVTTLVLAAVVMTVETSSDRFLERYLIVTTPLLLLAFACWSDDGRPRRFVGVAVACLLVVGAARLPVSEYAAGMGRADSPFLMAVGRATETFGVGETSLVVAVIVTVAALVGLASCLRRRPHPAIVVVVAAALLVVVSAGAHAHDIELSQRVEAAHFGSDPAWVDAAAEGDVLLVQTSGSDPAVATSTALWNTSVTRATALGEVDPIDGMAGELVLDGHGAVTLDGEPLTGEVVWATGGTRAVVVNPSRVVEDRWFTLTATNGPLHLAALVTGLTAEGWLGDGAVIRVFAPPPSACRTATMTLSVPEATGRARLRVGRESVTVLAGNPVRIRIEASTRPVSAVVEAPRPLAVPGVARPVAALAEVEVADRPCGER